MSTHAAHVTLTLSPAQIEEVLRAVGRDDAEPAMERLLGATEERHARERRYRALLADRRLSRSLLSGLLVLASFPPTGDLGVADLAQRLQMRTSTAHRYVSTLLAAGLLERDPASRRYRLARSASPQRRPAE